MLQARLEVHICLIVLQSTQGLLFQYAGFHNFEYLVLSSSSNLSCSYCYSPCNMFWNMIVSLFFKSFDIYWPLFYRIVEEINILELPIHIVHLFISVSFFDRSMLFLLRMLYWNCSSLQDYGRPDLALVWHKGRVLLVSIPKWLRGLYLLINIFILTSDILSLRHFLPTERWINPFDRRPSYLPE